MGWGLGGWGGLGSEDPPCTAAGISRCARKVPDCFPGPWEEGRPPLGDPSDGLRWYQGQGQSPRRWVAGGPLRALSPEMVTRRGPHEALGKWVR